MVEYTVHFYKSASTVCVIILTLQYDLGEFVLSRTVLEHVWLLWLNSTTLVVGNDSIP